MVDFPPLYCVLIGVYDDFMVNRAREDALVQQLLKTGCVHPVFWIAAQLHFGVNSLPEVFLTN